MPKLYLQDAFLQSLLASKELAEAGIKPTPLPTTTEHEAMAAVNSGAAALSVFSVAEADRRELQKSGSEAALLAQPFLFKSAEEVVLMQKSFLERPPSRCRPLRPFPSAIVGP